MSAKKKKKKNGVKYIKVFRFVIMLMVKLDISIEETFDIL